MSSTGASMQVNDVAPTATQKVQWYDILGQWRQAVADFDNNLAAVQSQAGNISNLQTAYPSLYSEYQKVMANVPAVQSRISELNSAITDVEAWLSGAWNDVKGAWAYVKTSVTSLFGLSCPTDQRSQGLGSLGQWQLVPLAVVAAGAAYVAAQAMDLYNVHTKLAAVQSYIAKGYTPAAAAALVAKTTSTGSIFSGISTTLQYSILALLAGGAVLWFAKRGRK